MGKTDLQVCAVSQLDLEFLGNAPSLFADGGGAFPSVAAGEDDAPHDPLSALLALAAQMDPVRWRRVSDVAQVAANFLRCHPRVGAVRYPGLKSDALFEEAARTLVGGFGPVLEFVTDDGWWRLTCGDLDARATCIALEHWLGTASGTSAP